MTRNYPDGEVSGYAPDSTAETLVLYCVRVPAANAAGCTAAEGLLYKTYLHRQVSPPETLVMKGGTTWARNGRWILPENARLPRNSQGSFTCRKSTTWDRRLYFSSEGRRAEDFSPWKIRRLRSGLNPRTWVPKASTLPLDHRSRWGRLKPSAVNHPHTFSYPPYSIHDRRQRYAFLPSVVPTHFVLWTK